MCLFIRVIISTGVKIIHCCVATKIEERDFHEQNLLVHGNYHSCKLTAKYEIYLLKNISVFALLIDLLLHKEIKTKTSRCPFSSINFVGGGA